MTMTLTCVYGMHSGHQCRSTGAANGIDVVVVQNGSSVGQGVNIWSFDLIRTVKTNIIPTQIIRNNYYDIRPLLGTISHYFEQ